MNNVAFSPDGKTLAAGLSRIEKTETRDEIVLWDMPSRQAIRRQEVPVGIISDLAFSPDGSTLAAGLSAGVFPSAVGGTVLWDLRDRKSQGRIEIVHEGGVTDVVFSPDGQTLATGCAANWASTRPGWVTFFDVATGRRLEPNLAVDIGTIQSLAFRPDGNTLVSGFSGFDVPAGRRGGVTLWEKSQERWSQIWTFDTPEGGVKSLAMSPDGTILAASVNQGDRGRDGVVIWSMIARRRLIHGALSLPAGIAGALGL